MAHVPAPPAAAAAPPAAVAGPSAAATERLWQVDATRGLMLVLMTLTHLPTRASDPAGQPFGFVSAAEGFVLLSGFMAGMVYAKREQRDGGPAMRAAFLARVGKIYLCQAALLVFLFTFVALLGIVTQEGAINDLMGFYRDDPLPALIGGLLLIYKPPLLDILPMYILFMLASPILLLHGLNQGWRAILAASVALWLGSQFGLGQWLYAGLVDATGLPVPVQNIGAFKVLAWQFLWVMGLWMGASRVTSPGVLPERFPRWMVLAAAAIALTGLIWRHAVGQTPFPGDPTLNLLFDKWQLAPLRLIDLFALVVLAMHFAPTLAHRLPRLRLLETLGAASLPVFCAHLVLALLALALFGAAGPQRPWAIDLAILGVSFAVLVLVALTSQHFDRYSDGVTKRFKVKRAARRQAAGGRRSRSSTPHSPPG